MLTKNHSFITKPEKFVKRRYSQALEIETPQNEQPKKKIRKLKSENDSDNLSISNDNRKSHPNGEFQEFLRNFMIPSNMYKMLAIRHRNNPIVLKRNLSYLRSMKTVDNQKSDLQTITEHLSTIRFHDENLALLKGKCPVKVKPVSYPAKIILKFDQFADSKTEKDWQTIQASVYVDVIHFYRDKRKNHEGFLVKRVLSNQPIKCNNSDNKIGPVAHSIDIAELINTANCYRVYKSVFHFKVLATERKIPHKSNNFISADNTKKSNEDTSFPVTYEAMMPLFGHRVGTTPCRQSGYFCQPGRYQIFMDVTDMEKCDDSLYSGNQKSVYDPSSTTETEKSLPIDSYWHCSEGGNPIDSPTKLGVMKNRARIVFEMENEDSGKNEKQKPMQTRNKSISTGDKSITNGVCKRSPSFKSDSSDVRLSSVRCLKTELNNFDCNDVGIDSIDVNIAYKFLVNDRIVQWTQTKIPKCPWCRLAFPLHSNLFELFKRLLSHLNNWHGKMEFSCRKLGKSRAAFQQALSIDNFVTIDVRLAKPVMDDIDFGHLIPDSIPVRRMPFSMVIYSKYQKPLVKAWRDPNHRRLYNHTWSAERLTSTEFDIDSESEENQQWLFDQYYRKVEEFSDLNHIEKRVIQIWNRDLLEYGLYLSDTQLKPFVDGFIQRIINDPDRLKEAKSMRNTLILHLVNLVDFGVLPSAAMFQCVKRLDDAIDKLI